MIYIYIYISTDGKIYDNYGFIGEDMYSFWDYALGTNTLAERTKGLITWAELGLDQKLYDAEQQLLAEDPITPEQKEFLRQLNPTLVD